MLSTAIGATVRSGEESTQRHWQFVNGLASSLNLLESVGFEDVYISDNTIANLSDLDSEISDQIGRIRTERQHLFLENRLGLLNKGAGVVTQLDRVLPTISETYQRVVFFEPRQRIWEPQIFLKILESTANVFRLQKSVVLRRNLIPWIFRSVHTGHFALDTSVLKSFTRANRPLDMVANNTSIERALYLHLRSRKVPFQAVAQLGITRFYGHSEEQHL